MHLLKLTAKTFSKSYIELSIWLFIFAVGIRFFEAILLSRGGNGFGASIGWNLTGLCYDIALFLRISVFILIIFVAACFLSETKTKIVFRILFSLMLLLSLIFIVFFTTSGFLLDKVIFTYSMNEIWSIVRSSSKSPVWVYIVIGVVPIIFFYLSGKRIKINRILLVIFAGLTLSSFFAFNNLPPSTNQYHVKTNKEYFFLKSLFKQTPAFTENDEEIIKTVTEFRNYFPELQFEEIEFPFLHQATYKDVLSPFFSLKTEPPNLVFIIVESLGYDIFKSDYQLMPFLDSLSKKSLSWEYCLSASARTFGVLPALFGAAPLGEKGFMEQCPNNPEHHSLPRILDKNGYTNHLFYGGWMGFDNMASFAKMNSINYFKEEDDWDQDIKDETIGATWGYEDHLTYLQAHRKLNHIKSSPRMDIYLSLTTHDPFEYPNSSYFHNIIENKAIQNNTLSEQEKKKLLNSAHILGGYAYSDHSIQQLIEGYKKRDDFENTIFIITGDHHPYSRQFGGFSNYHVPLIIYSPMLKSNRMMKGVVSHRDITPTLLSLLKNNYNIETPNEVAWLNTTLDTSLTFNANTFSPLQLIDHTLDGILYKNCLLCEGIVEKITDSAVYKIDDHNILQQMDRLLSLYRTLDLYVLYNDALIKNPYAHLKPTATIFEVNNTSYFTETSGLSIVEESKNHKSTLYIDETKMFFEFVHSQIPDYVNELMVELEFQYRIKESNENMSIIISIEKDGQSAFYHRDYLTADNQWNTFKKTEIIKKETYASLGDNCKLLAYIWNNNEIEGYIDDIKVRVTAN